MGNKSIKHTSLCLIGREGAIKKIIPDLEKYPWVVTTIILKTSRRLPKINIDSISTCIYVFDHADPSSRVDHPAILVSCITYLYQHINRIDKLLILTHNANADEVNAYRERVKISFNDDIVVDSSIDNIIHRIL